MLGPLIDHFLLSFSSSLVSPVLIFAATMSSITTLDSLAAAASNQAPAAPKVAAVAPKAVVKAAPPPIGILPSGTAVLASSQPTVASLSISLTPFLLTAVGLDTALPLPRGLTLIRSPDDKQTQLKLEPFFAKKLRRVFGYVAEITLSSGDGTDTPAQLQIATKIPRRYGSSENTSIKKRRFYFASLFFIPCEKELSWILVRLQAFASKALFSSAARVVALGSFVSGFTEPTSGNSRSCQVVGWDVCSIQDWRAISPTTVPPTFVLNMDAVYVIPQLSGANFSVGW